MTLDRGRRFLLLFNIRKHNTACRFNIRAGHPIYTRPTLVGITQQFKSNGKSKLFDSELSKT